MHKFSNGGEGRGFVGSCVSNPDMAKTEHQIQTYHESLQPNHRTIEGEPERAFAWEFLDNASNRTFVERGLMICNLFARHVVYPTDYLNEIRDEAWYFTLHQNVISLDHILILCLGRVNLIDGYIQRENVASG